MYQEKNLNAIKKLNKSVEYKISTNDELKILSQYQKISKNIKNDFEVPITIVFL